jgi:general secretion pathway protein K
VPLASARLSTFLAADRSDALAADDMQEAFLSGQMIDLQSRLNLTNLVQAGQIDPPSLLAFTRLFEQLNLPSKELDTLTQNLRLAQNTGTSADPQPASSSAPLWPQDLDQLAWLGVSPQSIAVLRPFVTILPVRTPVNLNTASAEVIYACVPAYEMADAHRLVNARNAAHLTDLGDAVKAGDKRGADAAQFNEAQHSVTTRFFEVQGQLRIEQTTVQEISVVQRDGLEVKTLWRKRGVAP